jgi:hypothetical protein
VAADEADAVTDEPSAGERLLVSTCALKLASLLNEIERLGVEVSVVRSERDTLCVGFGSNANRLVRWNRRSEDWEVVR